jgi:predicted nucleic acid-binding protein
VHCADWERASAFWSAYYTRELVTDPESRPYLLDTSALFTLIEDEPGADRVAELLHDHRVLVPFVAGLELYYITRQERSLDEAEQRLALVRQLSVVWLDRVTDRVLVLAGNFKAAHRISFADALVAGFAAGAGAILVHKDPEYDVLAGELAMETLPLREGRR